MDCWECNRPSHGVCRFCGRGVCRDHVKLKPYILSVFKNHDGKNAAIIVEDALYCGKCTPREAPVVLKGLA